MIYIISDAFHPWDRILFTESGMPMVARGTILVYDERNAEAIQRLASSQILAAKVFCRDNQKLPIHHRTQ